MREGEKLFSVTLPDQQKLLQLEKKTAVSLFTN